MNLTSFFLVLSLSLLTIKADAYEEASWYSQMKELFGPTERVRECAKRDGVAPLSGSSCSSFKTKTCFFGNQSCDGEDGGDNPAQVCRCAGVDDAKWVCEPFVCGEDGTVAIPTPSPVDPSVPSIPVVPMVPVVPVVPVVDLEDSSSSGTGGMNRFLRRLRGCEDENGHCHWWASKGECHANPSYMHDHCKASCGLCNSNTQTSSASVNIRADAEGITAEAEVQGDAFAGGFAFVSSCTNDVWQCEHWASTGQCHHNPGYMHWHCQSSCGTCTEFETGFEVASGSFARSGTVDNPAGSDGCVDKHPSCGQWARTKQCEKNPDYMLEDCKLSCNLCDSEEGVGADVPECKDMDSLCEYWASVDECTNNPSMLDYCPVSCDSCGGGSDLMKGGDGECKNNYSECADWASWNECDKSPDFMLRECASSCNAC